MISEEQRELAETVKSVHLRLRKRTAEIGADKAWEEHLAGSSSLQRYAKAMKHLAETHWEQNNKGDRQGFCRIQWIINSIQKYFKGGGYAKQIRKQNAKFKDKLQEPLSEEYVPEVKFKLLDVGSCYNPFKKYEFLDTYPIDLCPASVDVKKCNFLDVTLCEKDAVWWTNPLSSLPAQFFDVVVFCLFLEYLPSPAQRLKACRTAHSVLKEGGLLIIVTPDSKHQSANSKLMKTWKKCLAGEGFVRVCIEKLRYLYCMSFRKTSFEFYKSLPENEGWEEAVLSIPQDFVDYSDVDNKNIDRDLSKINSTNDEVAEIKKF